MQFILDCTTTLLTAFLCFFVMYRKYEIKKNYFCLRIVGIIGVIAIKMAILAFQIPPLNLLTIWLVCFCMIWLLYECQFITVLIISLVISMIALVSDSVGVLLVSSFYQNTITETIGKSNFLWNYHLWNWTLQIFLSRIIAFIVRKKYNVFVKWHELLFYVLLLLFQAIIFACVSKAIQDYMNGRFLILMMSGFMILDIYIMYILHKVSVSRENEKKIELMEQQESLQLQMYQELRKKYQETYAVAHDINRHVSSLKSLIAANPNQQAETYLSDLAETTNRLKPVIQNQNAILEIILNTIAARCEKEEISLELHIDDFPLEFISDMDITTIFSNVLDNAVDACTEISKSQRKIVVVLREQAGLIVLRITNSCRETKHYDFYHRISTKKYHSGIGLSNVKKAVDKYSGVIRIIQKENQFCVSITFDNYI